MSEQSPDDGRHLHWEGMWFQRSTNGDDARDTANGIELTADASGVRYTARGFDNGRQVDVASRSAQVRAYFERIDAANRAASAIIPYSKDMQVGKKKGRVRPDLDALVTCPVCLGSAQWQDCPLCDDERTVTLRMARRYLDLA